MQPRRSLESVPSGNSPRPAAKREILACGDVAGEAMTTRRHTRQMKRGRGSLRPIRTLVRERGGDRASVQERAGILRGGDSIP